MLSSVLKKQLILSEEVIMKKVKYNENCLFIGRFACGDVVSDGQTVKTEMIYRHVKSENTFRKCRIINTAKWKKSPFKLALLSVIAILRSETIILTIALNGMKFYFPLLLFISKIKSKKIYHFVIGGDIVENIKNNDKLLKYLKLFNANYVELKKMRIDLENLGLTNCRVIPNFKLLNIVNDDEVEKTFQKPYPVCTFSRISEDKGIADAISAVTKLNEDRGEIIYELTLYGLPYSGYEKTFQSMIEQFPSYVHYGGVIDFTETSEVLKEYYLLLFPTYHKGEGFAGTLIDAFSAGLPIIATDWNYNASIIKEGVTGKLFDAHDISALVEILEYFESHPNDALQMRRNCMLEAQNYSPNKALEPFYEDLKLYNQHSNDKHISR